MLKIRLLFLAIFIFVKAFSQKPENAIIGEWITSKKDGIITMYPVKSKNSEVRIYGKLSWISEPKDENGQQKKDIENPNVELRDRTILGLNIIQDLKWEGNNDEWAWEDGRAYDPESGNTYSFKAFIDPDKPDILNCRGYIGFSLIGRSEIWTRKK